jgi:hypothetical protein
MPFGNEFVCTRCGRTFRSDVYPAECPWCECGDLEPYREPAALYTTAEKDAIVRTLKAIAGTADHPQHQLPPEHV